MGLLDEAAATIAAVAAGLDYGVVSAQENAIQGAIAALSTVADSNRAITAEIAALTSIARTLHETATQIQFRQLVLAGLAARMQEGKL